MNLEYTIAKRLISSKNYKKSISAPIGNIAILAIALGVIMMFIAIATGLGLQNKIREKIAAFNGHISIMPFVDNQSIGSSNPIEIQQPFYPKFKTIQNIKHIQAVATKAGIIRTPTAFEPIILKAVGADYDWNNFKEYITKGRIPNLKNQLNNEIIISQFLADRLNLKLNQQFNTFFIKEQRNGTKSRRFKIVGIYNTGFPEFDTSYIIADIRHLQMLNKWKPNQAGSFEVFLHNFNQISQKGQEIYQNIPPTLNTQTIEQKYFSTFDWLKLFDFNILLILAIMLLVSIINIVVALLVLILERTQMIGILKSLGATNNSIRKIFLYQALYLITKGLIYGNTIALTLLLIQHHFKIIKLNPENYYVTEAPVHLDPLLFLLTNLLILLICLLTLIIPTTIITKITPTKAIRYQ